MLRRFGRMFEGGAGAAGGEGGAAGGDPAGNGGGEGGGGGQSQAAGGAGANEVRMSTAALAERLQRGGQAAVSEFLRNMGFDSPEALQTLVKEHRDAAEANKTELQRAQDAAAAAERRAAEATAAATAALVRNAVIVEAGKAGIPADRLDAAVRLIDSETVTVKDGVVSGADAAVAALVETAPWIKAGTAGGTKIVGAGANGGASGGTTATDLTDEERLAAERAGISPERYAAAKQSGRQGDTPSYQNYLAGATTKK